MIQQKRDNHEIEGHQEILKDYKQPKVKAVRCLQPKKIVLKPKKVEEKKVVEKEPVAMNMSLNVTNIVERGFGDQETFLHFD